MAAAAEMVNDEWFCGINQRKAISETPSKQPRNHEIRDREGELEEEHRRSNPGQQSEAELSERRINCGQSWVIDLLPPFGAESGELRCGGRKRVGIESVQLNHPLPHVPPDVIAGVHCEEQHRSRRQGSHPKLPSSEITHREQKKKDRGHDTRTGKEWWYRSSHAEIAKRRH